MTGVNLEIGGKVMQGPIGPPGVPGKDGRTIHTVQSAPDGSLGLVGDYAISPIGPTLYGPKTSSG